MKRKILVFAPLFALFIAGCMPRIPLPPTSGQSTSTSSTSGSGPTTTTTTPTSTSTSTTTTPPGPAETYGSLDNPISVAQAIQIAQAIPGAQSDNTVYETKDAYVGGIVLNAVEESSKTAGTYRFNIGDAYGSQSYVQLYWGALDSGVTVPVEGDSVVLFGRLAYYHANLAELTGYKSQQIPDPQIKKSQHVSCTMTVTPAEHGTLSGIPETALTGTKIDITATPETDYSVEYVKANGVSLIESEGKYSFTVKQDTTITASFVQGPVVKTSLQIAYEAAIAGSKDELTFTGTVTSMTGTSYTLQDGDYAINVYQFETENVALGKKVEVVSTLKLYQGCPQTNSVKSATVQGDGDEIEEALVSSKADLDALNHGVLTKLVDAKFVSKNKEWTSGQTAQYVFAVGNDNLTVSFDKVGYDATKAAELEGVKVDDKFDFNGLVTAAYSGTNQFNFTGTSIVKNKAEPIVPDGVQIKLSTYSLVEGGQVELVGEITPEGAQGEIEWTLTGEHDADFAHIAEGKLFADHAGTVTLTATVKGTQLSDSKEVTITAPQHILVNTITPNPTSIEMRVGDDPVTVTYTVDPENVEEEIEFIVKSESTEGVVEVNSNNQVIATAAGTAVVRIQGKESGNGVDIPVTVAKALSTLEAAYNAGVQAGSGESDEFVFRGVVTSTTGTSFSVQDGEFAINVYKKEVAGIAVGKLVELDATITLYNGCPQVKTHKADPVIIGDGTPVTPAVIDSMATLTALKGSALINVASAELVEKKTWSSGSSPLPVFKVGDDNITVKFDKDGYDDSKAAILNALEVGDCAVLSNVIKCEYKGTAQLFFAGSSSIQAITVDPESVSLTATPNEIFVGGTSTISSTINPPKAKGNVILSLAEGDDEFATLENGVLTGIKAKDSGPVTINAVVEGYPDAKGSTQVTIKALEKNYVTEIVPTPASIELTVGGSQELTYVATYLRPSDPVDEAVTMSIAEGGDAYISLTEGVVTAVAAGTTSVRIQGAESHIGVDVPVTVNAPAPETYGTLDNPITIAEARTIAAALEVENGKTTYETKDAYVRGIAKKDAEESSQTAGTYRFYVGDTIDASDDLTFYWGVLADGVSAPKAGEEVTMFGRLAHYKNNSGKSTYELAGKSSLSIDNPVVLSSIAPQPSGIQFKESSYELSPEGTKDLAKEVIVTPTGAQYALQFSATGSSKIEVSADGNVTVAADATNTDTATVTVSIVNSNLSANCTITVDATPPTPVSKVFNKITSTDELTDGKYLIVCESANVSFDGSLATLDAVGDKQNVTISESSITYSEELEAITFTYNSTDKTLKSSSGYYIGQTNYANGLLQSATEKYVNNISFSDGDAVISCTTGTNSVTLRYNNASNQARFRYYKSGQQAVQLYKLEESGGQQASALPVIAQGNQATKVEGAGVWIYLDNTDLGITGANAADIIATLQASVKIEATENTPDEQKTAFKAEPVITSTEFNDYGTGTVRLHIVLDVGYPNEWALKHTVTVSMEIGGTAYAATVVFVSGAYQAA